MPSRVAAVFCLVLVAWSASCRKTLGPEGGDIAPETWIVAAPQDTVTTRDSTNTPIAPQIGRIPFRFHMYWAGSDRDGAVVGFYWAVVETLPVAPAGSPTVPPLPGPKARDYRYTTRTDSIFVFTTSVETNERQHAFYIYAVDDKGRADPTPARFVFRAYDRFPPRAVIDECSATGTEYVLRPGGGGVDSLNKTYLVTDFYEISNDHAFPRDTVMSNARLHMRWHAESTSPSTIVTGYRYKLDERAFNVVDSSVHECSYNTGVGGDKVNPGQKIFRLQAVGQSGWRGEATRWFQMNFAPDTWFSGPDPNDPRAGWQTVVDGNGKRYWYLDFGNRRWDVAFRGIQGTMLSADSAFALPAVRLERKSFFEVYGQRLWLRQEEDTVHMNSWVIIPGGGFDKDSPYAVRSNMTLFGDSLSAYPVLTPRGPNGSPIGFRLRIQLKDLSGAVTQPSETTPYPVVDPTSYLDRRAISGYWALTSAGRAYAVLRAEDGNGAVDGRVDQRPGGAVGIADRVDASAGSPEDRALRSKVLTFFVDHVPVLQQNLAGFYPTPGATLPRDTTFNLPSTDDDPYDPMVANVIGGPNNGPILRWKIAVLGKRAGTGKDTCFIAPTDFLTQRPSIQVPDWMASGDVTVRIRLCDCMQCDVLPGTSTCPFGGHEVGPAQGRCVDTDIRCTLQPPRTTAVRVEGR